MAVLSTSQIFNNPHGRAVTVLKYQRQANVKCMVACELRKCVYNCFWSQPSKFYIYEIEHCLFSLKSFTCRHFSFYYHELSCGWSRHKNCLLILQRESRTKVLDISSEKESKEEEEKGDEGEGKQEEDGKDREKDKTEKRGAECVKQGEKKKEDRKGVLTAAPAHWLIAFASYISKHLGTLITFRNTKLSKFPLSLPLSNLSVFFLATLIFF